MMRRLFYVNLLFFVCAGCMVGPDDQKFPEINDSVLRKQMTTDKNMKISATWYEDWDDPQLNRLIVVGLRNNTDVRTAISRLKQARAQLQMHAVQYLPSADVQGGYNYQKSSRKIGYKENSQYYTAGFDADWEIDLWGKGRRQIQGDEATRNAMEYNLKNVQAVVTAEIAMQYVFLAAAKEKLRLAEENTKLQRQIVQNVRAQFESGLTDELSYRQAEYMLENTMSKIPRLKSDVEQYYNALGVLVGEYPENLTLKTDAVPQILKKAQKISIDLLEKLPADVVRKRPDVAAAEQNLIAQNAQVGMAVADLYPSVHISALWGFAAKSGRELFGSDSHTYSYAPLVQLPLLDWNKLQNNVRLQKYIRDEYVAQYKAIVLKAVSELRNAMMQVRQNVTASKNQARALEASRKMISAVLSKYDNGLVDFSEVLTNEQRYLEAQDAYVTGKTSVLQSVIAYYKAAGGGY